MADSPGIGGEEVESLAFTVDTHLLRELGTLLVGRDSTALVELLKNAYDADATRVVVHGERLADEGNITVDDDGHGMSYSDFTTKFLRIAGRSKEEGERRSPRFRRKYTGAKGIGRLAAHKLGKTLTLESAPRPSDRPDTSQSGFRATINWEAIEDSELSIDQTREIIANRISAGESRPGTLLTVDRLHSEWTTRQLNEFLNEVRSTRPDPALHTPIANSILPDPLLIPEIRVADSAPSDPGFSLELSGEFAGFETQWPTLLAHINWVIEIDARGENSITYQITPTRLTLRSTPEAATRSFTHRRKGPGPRFAARIFVRDGSGSRGKVASPLPDMLARFARESAGVRLFFEGFRVLPYGSARNDWLGLDRNYARRESLQYVDDTLLAREARSAADERTYLLANSNYFGAVFLHDEDSAGLQMVVNREGFLPGDALDDLIENVRRGIDLSVRIRASHGAHAREVEAEKKRQQAAELLRQISESSSISREDRAAAPTVQTLLAAGTDSVRALGREVPATAVDARRHIEVVKTVLDETLRSVETASDEQAQLRVLASLGTQVGAFVHEVNGLLAQARTIRELIDRLLESGGVTHGRVRELREVRRAQNELVASLERQAVYLSDTVGAEARRRRVRQRVSERWATAERLLSGAAERRRVEIRNEIPESVRTRPMFPAELNVIFTNLLSNAIKAAVASPDEPRLVRVAADEMEDGTQIVVENTGTAVDLATADRWFRPFETTTSELDATLGQGMGLGLTLTRRIVEEYGGAIEFTAPSRDMATSIRVILPNS